MSFHLFISSLISFNNVLFSMYKAVSSGVKFIPRYLFHFDASINEIVHLIFFFFWIIHSPGVFNSQVVHTESGAIVSYS